MDTVTVALEEFELMKDQKYRVYVSAVDKALKYFENTNEWQDLISALGKLNKVLETHHKYPVIPRRIKISKRLAQCMHPALPSGVHLKALATYDIIFKCIGTDRLSHELFIYSAGLFPLLSYAASNIRPILLTVYETHFVPLGERLKPGLSGFLSGILPGLEEGSENFERTNILLEQVSDGVGKTYFYGCLWESVGCNSAIRLPAITFVLSHYNKKINVEDQLYVLGTNIDVLVNALCCGVQDTSVLVQRSSLELLLVAFPMHNNQLTKSQMVLLITAALSTILRRDISLNRRLYAWLLGSDINFSNLSPEHPLAKKAEEFVDRNQSNIYFDVYCKELLIQGIVSILNQKTTHGPDIRPYRLLISLLDKQDIGPVILDDILYEVFRALFAACSSSKPDTTKHRLEVLKAANIFFSSLEPSYIWEYSSSLYSQACKLHMEELTTISEVVISSAVVKPVASGLPNIWEVCELCEFLLEEIPIEACSNTPSEHLPRFFLHLISEITKNINILNNDLLSRSLILCSKILSKIRPSIKHRKISKSESVLSEKSDSILKNSEFANPGVVRSRTSSELVKTAVDIVQTVIPVKKISNVDDKFTVQAETSNFTLTTNEPEPIFIPEENTLFRECLRQFEKFYLTLFSNERIIINKSVPEAFHKLLNISNSKTKPYESELRRILTAVMNNEAKLETFTKNRNDNDRINFVIDVTGNEKWEKSVKIASDILVDLSTLPVYSLDDTDADEKVFFPPWLKVLIVCSCYLKKSYNLQLIVIKGFLDLVSVCQANCSTPGLVTLLNFKHIKYLEENTIVPKVMTQSLWDHLGKLTLDLQVVCVQLLYQLHSTFCNSDHIERVIGDTLLNGTEEERVENVKKFGNVWHVGRELHVKHMNKNKLFHNCLLKMLGHLQLTDNNSCLKLQSQTWLNQSLMRGDIARLLEPVLLMLLDPATARMGVLHVSIQQSGGNNNITNDAKVESEDNGRKIYAISSVDGNIIYHVSNSDKGSAPKRLKWRWKKETEGHEKLFVVTSLKNVDERVQRYVTERNYVRDIELPPTINGGISVFVNPFSTNTTEYESLDESSDTNLTDSVKIARRVDKMQDATNADPKHPKITLEVTTTDSPTVETKYKNRFDDLEESHSADEYFNQILNNPSIYNSSTSLVVEDVLEELLNRVFRTVDGASGDSVDCSKTNTPSGVGVHPLHSHMLLYCGVYDSCRTLYAFTTLKNIVLSNPRMFLCSTSTSGIMNSQPHSELLVLLARHRKCVFGRSFHGDSNSLSEYGATYRSSMYIEVLVSICLYFARSYYPNLGLIRLTVDEIAGNRQVQLAAIDLLTHLFSELIPIVRESKTLGESIKGFCEYIGDMLNRCKVQKIILHSVMSSIHAIQQQLATRQPGLQDSTTNRTFTEEIVEFNDPFKYRNDGVLTEHCEAQQIQLLRVLLSLLVLEREVDVQKIEDVDQAGGKDAEPRYSPGCRLPQQPLFLKALSAALRSKGHMRYLHNSWTTMITTSLPYLGPALQQVVLIVINQLCNNIEELATYYNTDFKQDEKLPPDYGITQMEALISLVYYCVLDSNQQITATTSETTHTATNTGQILNNLVHVFTPIPLLLQDTGKEKQQPMENLATVRRSVLSSLPRIISSIAKLWQAVTTLPDCDSRICLWGNPRLIKQQILELLSPLSIHHGVNLLAAIAVTWQERRSIESVPSKQLLPTSSPGQQVLVNLVNAIRVMPIDTLVQTVHQVVKQPPPIHGSSQDVSLDVSVLELFYVYIQTSSGVQLVESWSSVLTLLRDGLSLAPPALFLTVAILNEFVQKSPPFSDKKDQRDLQDITSKLVESCGNIAGACLEQKTWLGRNLAVKEDIDSPDDDVSQGSTSFNQQYSVQAQLLLAQVLAPLLDISYGSQEKEKVVALLTTLMYNVTPYLKNHLPRNAPSFLACSQLLSSLSGFQYTRKAWKKDVFDLLLDPALFQMESECLQYWTTIIDNLMTHDMTTFRELMNRISVAQPGSYSLFSSKEQEYEQRAQLLKRLAFVIFCSETDQYHKFMHTIQERLSESLRLPQVIPAIQAQVFLCFRVLLLRMSSQFVTSLWPIIISEMVQVFMHLEQELVSDTDEFSSHIRNMSALDSSWVVNANNGLHAHGNPHWLMLSLATAKLLDLAVLLPSHHLPQFQMYRWAFVSDTDLLSDVEEHNVFRSQEFIPHVTRIAQLMDRKYGRITGTLTKNNGQLLLTENAIDSLTQLHLFFASLNNNRPQTVDMEALENVILNDFLEKMPNKNH